MGAGSDPSSPDEVRLLLRADDLLALTFQFFNLRLGPVSDSPRRMVTIDPSRPAFIVVLMAPQHIVHQVFDQDPQRPGALTDLIDAPVASVMAGRSRLAFQLPAGTASVPFSLATLLDWNSLISSLAPNALADPPDLSHGVPATAPPTGLQTAIELPYRIVLSPDPSGRWAHSIAVAQATAAATATTVTELWHTRLGTLKPGATAPDDRTLPALRPVWADTRADVATFPLSSDNRRAILAQSGTFRQADGTQFPAPALRATHLTLSALGGWTDIQAGWDQADPTGESTEALAAWRHVASQGLDQYVRVAMRGSMYPFGHRASVVEITERKPASAPGGALTDYLVRSTSLVVLQAERDYDELAPPLAGASASIAAAQHKMPFRRVRITTMSAHIDPPATDRPSTITQRGQPFPFQLTAADWAGATTDFALSMTFVSDGTTVHGQFAAEEHLAPADASLPAIEEAVLRGQAIALSPTTRDRLATTLPVQRLRFGTVSVAGLLSPSYLPFVDQADVSLTAVQRVVGAVNPIADAVTVQLAEQSGDIFARLVGSPLRVGIPAQLAGGLTAPNLAIGALSQSLGPVPAIAEQIGQAAFDPKALFAAAGLDTSLLGGVSLADVIAATGVDVTKAQIPSFIQAQLPDQVTTTFEWKPKLTDRPLPVLKLAEDSTLEITATMSEPISPSVPPPTPTAVVRGKLTDFSLEFADVLTVSFTALAFSAETGKKVDVDPQGLDLAFANELQFLSQLADVIPAGLLGAGVELHVSPAGIDAGYTLGLPSAGVAVFSLENIALSVHAFLPLQGDSGPASLRVAFSDRAHPFLVTVAMIGGGGFFAIEVEPTGIKSMEGSIEIGAQISVDLGIVSAEVHVLGGFYFSLRDQRIDFTGYLRVGGSVELLGIAGVSIDFYLGLTYEPEMLPPSIGGRASVTIGVRLLMFTKTVTLSAERHFPIPGAGGDHLADDDFALQATPPSEIPFDQLLGIDDWQRYCETFA